MSISVLPACVSTMCMSATQGGQKEGIVSPGTIVIDDRKLVCLVLGIDPRSSRR